MGRTALRPMIGLAVLPLTLAICAPALIDRGRELGMTNRLDRVPA